MINLKTAILTGIRASKLSVAQARHAAESLKEVLPALTFELVPMSSPGDRDRQTDLRAGEPDFFTRDLDDAVLDGRLECAIHSAKDLPEPLRDGLDMFYLPWREDPRDVLIWRFSEYLPERPRIGVSSVRREEYCRKRFPEASILPIRGNIDDRLNQLDAGKYDLLIMAAAGLNRLGLAGRIAEYIPVAELPPPEGQGALAITFRHGDPVFNLIRQWCVKPVVFAGAGTGSTGNTTLGVIAALQQCEICLYDALCPPKLLDYLPRQAAGIAVGKRMGLHSCAQDEICQKLLDYARRGRKVLRLKGGDPGIFGRLAEEVEMLDRFQLPFQVLPGVSSLNAATTGTGLLLTRRGLSRGFCVAAPRQAGSDRAVWFTPAEKQQFPLILFMATRDLAAIAAGLAQDGYAADTPVAIVLNAGGDDSRTVTGRLNNIAGLLPASEQPGIVMIGANASPEFLYRNYGPLRGRRILFAGSETLAGKAAAMITAYGGVPVLRPMIRLTAIPGAAALLPELCAVDYLIVTSPAGARLLMETLSSAGFDLRRLPQLIVSGPGTAAEFTARGIYPEISAAEHFGTAGLLAAVEEKIKASDRVIRLCSDVADDRLTTQLQRFSAQIRDVVFYHNINIAGEYISLPEFNDVVFTSPSGVAAFIRQFGVEPLQGKTLGVIGEPTRTELLRHLPLAVSVSGREATINSLLSALAARQVNALIETEFSTVHSIIRKGESHE